MAIRLVPVMHTIVPHLVRRIVIADFVLFVMSFLAYIVQQRHQRKVLLLNSNDLSYDHRDIVRIRNYKYGSAILNHGAASVLSMIVVTILSGYYRKITEILIWIITGFFIVWAIATIFKRHHVLDMVFGLICLGVYSAFFGIIFAHAL